MNGYNFTERVRKVLAMSREEAARLRHEYVGTEHLLLAMVREGESVATSVLENLNVDLRAVTTLVEANVKGGEHQATGPDLPYTSRAKKVLELSMKEARDLHHTYVGVEHLLLGLLAEEKGIAAQVLVVCGASIDTVRAETMRILGTNPNAGNDATAIPARAPQPSIEAVVIEIRLEDGSTVRKECRTTGDAMQFLARESFRYRPGTS